MPQPQVLGKAYKLFMLRFSGKGWDFKAIVEEAETFKFKVRSEFTVGDIKYLIKKGRVSSLVAKFINLIKIKFLLKGSLDSKIEFRAKYLVAKLPFVVWLILV